MSTDRELLELAAKAAGIVGVSCDEGWWVAFTKEQKQRLALGAGNGYVWNPLTDDGDALRLAVTLGLTLYIGRPHVTAEFNGLRANETSFDNLAATRRTIVRVAAEIGRHA
jgi:hypothetical protein